ncbi:MarR family winged helix-turn-helix transcriptional regulator [Brotaphodocola sp.]|uniref:MarR family winged helix-turn-helix transcriptional regulator n=1 Tax=Brotaphodocola sp. TaxID=3073577 RepID=UPI003D7E0DED
MNLEKDKNLYERIYQINCLTEEVDSLYHQAGVRLGVSDSVLFILYMLYIKGGSCLLYEVYKLSGISKQTINSAIRKLEQDDIVYLENHNGKSKIVCLTEAGKDYAERTAKKLFEAECTAFEEWSKEELDLYFHLIEKHNASLRKQIERL